MTRIEEEALKVYPDDEGLREAYIKGAKEFCLKIWAKIKVYETFDCVGHNSDETISMATYSNKLYQLSNFAYDLCHETNIDDD